MIDDKKLQNVLYKLKDLYPQYSLEFIKTKKKNTEFYILYVNNKPIYTFNPNILELDIDFLKDDKNYNKYIIQIFKSSLDTFHKSQVKRERRKRGLSLQLIQEAINNTKSNSQAAKYIGVSYPTYRKYAKKYGKWEEHLNPKGIGCAHILTKKTDHGKLIYTLDKLIEGKIPKYWTNTVLKFKLISAALLKEECLVCGFNERRILDLKIPLLIDYIDCNYENRRVDNIRLLCHNCYFLYVGNKWFQRKHINEEEFKKAKLDQPRKFIKDSYDELELENDGENKYF